MRKLMRLWVPLLLGVLLMATLVGVATARPDTRPQQQAWRLLTVPAADCGPSNSLVANWTNWGDYMLCDVVFACEFFCPVHFPAAGEQAVGAVNVKRLTLYFKDQVAGDVVARLRKSYPPAGVQAEMAVAQSFGINLSDPASVMDTSIANNPVYRNQGPYVYINMNNVQHKVYGVYIHYTW
jgi:hypothetical protein